MMFKGNIVLWWKHQIEIIKNGSMRKGCCYDD